MENPIEKPSPPASAEPPGAECGLTLQPVFAMDGDACDPNGAGCGDVNDAATGGTLATAL